MGKVIKKIVITLLVIALIAGGVYGGLIVYRNANREPVKTFSVSDFHTQKWYSNENYAYGLVTTDKLQKVYASDSQTITEIYVEYGQEVKVGDPILSYDTTLSDIDLEKAQISHQKLLMSYETAKKELEVINQLRPHQTVVIKATPVEITYTPEVTPEVLSGTGSFDDPFYCIFSMEDALTDEMIEELYAMRVMIVEEEKKAAEEEQKDPAEPEDPTEPAEEDPAEPAEPSEEETTEKKGVILITTRSELIGQEKDTVLNWYGGSFTKRYVEATEPEDPAEPEDPTDPTEPADPTEPEDPTDPADPSDPEDPEEPVEESIVAYAAFVTRDQDALNGMVLSEWGIEIGRNEADTGYQYRNYYPLLPPEAYEYDQQPEDIWKEYGSDYSAEEIASMKKSKEEEIKGYEDQIRLSGVELERLQQEISDSKVYAKIDGTVNAVNDPEMCRYDGNPVVEVSAGGGYYIEVSMGEYDLDTMQIGQTVTVNSWQTGTQVEGIVSSIGTDPVEDNNSWGSGSQHVSYYPFTVFVDESANLMENDYVDVYYTSGSTGSDPDAWYLENIFIRTEGGKSYVLMKGEDGLLKKQIIQTGKSLDGYHTEIRGGLTLEDRIAFPYGKNTVEGAETVDGTVDDFYGMYN